MSCCFKNAIKAGTAPPDPTRHVRYTHGMVLGVDDFEQEFAYLSGRDHWIVRDLLGYGTVRGLAVRWDAAKVQVEVDAGVGVTPCGQLVCVPEKQCANLNKWLAEHAEEVAGKLAHAPAGTITLHVVLGYRGVPTDTVPIPGEPCRSEDELKQPSRTTDDFVLELVFDAPPQREEDDLREFVGWLRAIPQDAASTPHEDFLAAVAAWQPGAGPPALAIKPDDAAAYMADAVGLWVTVLRPQSYGRSCGCAGVQSENKPDHLLLASLAFDVQHGETLHVASLKSQDETRRPLLLTSRALQELIRPAPPPAAPPPPDTRAGRPRAAGEARVVAAGTLRGDDRRAGRRVLGGLRVVAREKGQVTFSFDGYAWPNERLQYVVKALAVAEGTRRAPQVGFAGFAPEGFALQVAQSGRAMSADALADLEFMVEVVAFPVPA